MKASNAERVRSIFAAATSLFGARSPETVTMEEIAAGAGVAKGTLYTYFESKDELLRELLASRLTEMIGGLEETEGSPRDRLARIVRHLFRFQTGAPDFFWFLQRARGCAETRAVIREREATLIAMLQRVLQEPGFAAQDCERGAVLVLGAVERAVARCLEAEPPCDAEAELSELRAFLDRALGAGLPSLAGRTIVVTRDEAERGPLSEALRARGATVIRVPLVATEPAGGEALSNACARLADYDWLVFTSARAVRAMAAAGRSNGIPNGAPNEAPNGHRARVAAVGASTASAARAAGFAPDVVGSGGAEALAGELEATLDADGGGLRGATVLYPVSDRALPEGIAAFESLGARVTAVEAYRTVPVDGAAERLAEVLAREPVHAITFASPSAVEVFAAGNLLEKIPGHPTASRSPALFALGATTARALADHGFGHPPHPGRPGFDALAELVARSLAELPED